MLFRLAAYYDLPHKQFDVLTAFLNALIGNQIVYVEQPHGFKEWGSDFVCLL
jgi:hypothetical protein